MKKYVVTAPALIAALLLMYASCAGVVAEIESGAKETGTATGTSAGNARVDADSPPKTDSALPKQADSAAPNEKQSVAVYMAGEERGEIRGAYKILGGELARAISASDKYTAVNRTEAILEILGQEHVYQRSGAVTDEQIMDLGGQVGAQYLCIAEISEVRGGAYYLDVRLVDVVTAKTASSATAGSDLADINEMIRAAQELAHVLLGGKGVAPKPTETHGPAYADAKPAGRAGGADFSDDKIGVEMAFVKGGAFVMGCTPEQESCWDSEKPAHRVTLTGYYIGKYPVTQKQWRSVMGTNPSETKGDGLPVTDVTWDEVQVFIAKVRKATGRKYRLPTEAEWEYAARGGEKGNGYRYAGSDNIDEVAWYDQNSKSVQRAGAKKPNELGIYDMSGNIYEWVNDRYGDYESRSQADPPGPQSGSMRVQRGGPYFKGASYMRIAFRTGNMPGGEEGVGATGFRLAMSPGGEPNTGDPLSGSSKTDKKINISTVFVKGGAFKMGCTEEEDKDCDKHLQRHEVTLKDFYISKYPVTQKEWYDVMGATLSDRRDNLKLRNRMPGGGEGDNYPMYYVNMDDVQEFLRELNKITGKKYRLPTEAEWEYAARGGAKSKGYRFAGSDDIAEAGWYFGNSGDRLLGEKDWGGRVFADEKQLLANNNRVRAVGGKKPNELGIYDMTGNVREWVYDYYDLKYYSVSPRDNPRGPAPAYNEPYRNDRVLRGGSWRENANSCYLFYRRGMPQIARADDIGFRLVLPAE